jgi:glycosyltransferase involved in cell wall biosynthesis
LIFMHIAFITIGFTPFRTSGLDISGERLVTGLLKHGNRVTVIAGSQDIAPETMSHPNLKILRIPLGKTNWIGFGWQAAFQLRRLVRHDPCDIIHFWDIYFAWAFYGTFIGSLQHSFQQRIVTSRNVGISKKLYYALSLQFAERPTIHRAKRLLAGSVSSMENYIQDYHIPKEKVTLTRHGIDTDFFQRNPDTHSLRTQLGILQDEPVLMYSGFFTPRKGLEYLAQAMSTIQPMPRLVLTGRWSEDFRERFFDLLGPAQDQVIEAGFVPDELMPSYFSMADVYVSSSLLEGFGLPIAEALACETPIVAANAGSVSEVAGPGGVLVAPGDATALAAAVSSLLADPARRLELGQRGRAHILQNFSLESMVDTHLEAYRRFLSSEPRF